MANPMIKLPGNHHLPKGLLNNTAGLFVSGDPGCGKSVLGREIHRSLAMSGDAMVIVLAPDNDFVEDCLRDVSDMPLSVRQRAHAFYPANPKWPVGAINPLHVDCDETTSAYEYEARLECRAMFASHLLLSSVNQADFDGAPLLLKWATTINRSLARMHMTMPEAEQFFDIGSEDYQLLTSAIPDAMAQVEFSRLAALKIDQQEEKIASFKNRHCALFSNPIVRAHLGAVKDTLPLRQLMQENSLLYFNLSQGEETLSTEAQSLLANIILSEIFHILFTTPRSQRQFVVILCDELPVFRSSATLISRALRRSRKLGLRFIGMAQGTQAFPEGIADPLLHTMTGCCNAVVMRHSDPVDAEYFGKYISLPTRSVERVKYEHVEDQQYQARNEIQVLVNRSVSTAYGDAEGEAGSEGEQGGEATDSNWSNSTNSQITHSDSDNQTETTGVSDTKSDQQSTGAVRQLSEVGDLYGRACSEAAARGTARSNNSAKATGHGQSDAIAQGVGQSQGGSFKTNHGWSQQASWNRTRNSSKSSSISYTQQIVPVLAWRKIVRVELMSLDEQDQETATKIALLDTGEGFFYAAGEPIAKAFVNRPHDYLLGTSKTAADLFRQLLDEMFAAPFYQFGEDILRLTETARELFLTELRQYAAEGRLISPKFGVARELSNLPSGPTGISIPQTPMNGIVGETVRKNTQLILPTDDELRNAPWSI